MTFIKRASIAFIMAIITVPLTPLCMAEVILTEDRNEWENMVGEFTTIDFTGFPHLTPITNQYADQGVNFSGSNFIIGPACNTYENDCWGLQGIGGTWVHFDEPMNWIGVEFPGVIAVQLFSRGELIFESTWFGVLPAGNFLGLTSSNSFDEVYFFRPVPPFSDNISFIDDLHFGAIPAPGALGLLALGGLVMRRRQRL